MRSSCGGGPGAECEGAEAGTPWEGAGPEQGALWRGSSFLPEPAGSPAGLAKPGSALVTFGVPVGEAVI